MDPQNPCEKNPRGVMLIIWGNGGRWIPVARWPVSLAKSASGRPLRNPVSRNKVESVSRDPRGCTLAHKPMHMCIHCTHIQTPTCTYILTQRSTHVNMHTQVCMQSHTQIVLGIPKECMARGRRQGPRVATCGSLSKAYAISS